MKDLIKYITILFSIVIFASCNSPNSYKYEVTHINGIKENIIIDDNNPQIDDKDRFTSECGCETYSTNVKQAKFISVITISQEQINKIHSDRISLSYKLGLFVFLLIFFSFIIIKKDIIKEKLIKLKNNLMWKIVKIIGAIFSIVIIIKIGFLLVRYLPGIIENHLK